MDGKQIIKKWSVQKRGHAKNNTQHTFKKSEGMTQRTNYNNTCKETRKRYHEGTKSVQTPHPHIFVRVHDASLKFPQGAKPQLPLAICAVWVRKNREGKPARNDPPTRRTHSHEGVQNNYRATESLKHMLPTETSHRNTILCCRRVRAAGPDTLRRETKISHRMRWTRNRRHDHVRHWRP